MVQILASTESGGALADGEKALVKGDPSVRREPLYSEPQLEGLSDVPEGALIRLDCELYDVVSGMSGWRSKIVNELLLEGCIRNVQPPCVDGTLMSGPKKLPCVFSRKTRR